MMSSANSELLESFWSVAKQHDLEAVELNSIRENLQQRFESPPTALLAASLGLEALGNDEVRQLLFAPTSYHMGLYPQLLSGDSLHPGDYNRTANKVQVMVWTHLLLVHGRCWERLRPFIAAGGFRQLVQLLANPLQIMAAQAMHLLILATHPDMYNWNPAINEVVSGSAAASSQRRSHHTSSSSGNSGSEALQAAARKPEDQGSAATHCVSTPPVHAGKHPAAGPDGDVWLELLQLQSGPLFTTLLGLSPDVWPQSGYMAVQFLWFYLSWLRKWWSKDGVLQLSPAILTGLAAWSKRESASPEERQIAGDLLADFGSCGPAPAVPGRAADAVSVSCGDEQLELRVVADRTYVNSRPGSEAECLKAAGNDAFKAKDWSTAIQLYSAALDVPVPHVALLDEGPRRAAYHANRAAAYLERYKETTPSPAGDCTGAPSAVSDISGISACTREIGGVLDGLVLHGSGPEACAQLLQAAVMDCKAALDLAPTHTKAHYRLATALKAQGSLKAAQVSARSAGQYAGCPADRTAAAQLEAAISRQLAERELKQQHAQQLAQAGTARAAAVNQPQAIGRLPPVQQQSTRGFDASSSSKRAQADRQQQAQQEQHALPEGAVRHQARASAVDQLLQQFAATIKQQVTSSGAATPAADQTSGAAGSNRAGVLLPSAARQQELDQHLVSDQIVMPGASNSSSACRGQQAGACKPLIQEVSGNTQDAEHPAPCADNSSSLTNPQQLQQQEGCLEQLLDVLD